ncbi:MAG: hypothetical protein APF84_13115 [Gracilibacter sp. BRH_c7a]|nr:MAG: hypothetical protein APF84_13115 [Gracilibacter sp. BRH_c7a]
MNTINLLSGPAIGALIGYATNYLAVKMLFRPLHPIKIGSFRLPFTPGIFPKRKEQLAKALGQAVGNNLVTGEDLGNLFLTEAMKGKVVTEIMDLFFTGQESLKTLLADHCRQEDYLRGKAQLEEVLCEKIASGISRLDLKELIVKESSRIIREKTAGTMLAVMANDKLIASVTVPMAEKMEAYFKENGSDIVRSVIKSEIERLENRPLGELVLDIGLDRERLSELVDKVYTGFIRYKVAGYLRQLDIAGIVEQKVNAMDVREIEELVLSVMKRELNAIVNLGALVGLVIGTLHIFI